MQRECIKMASTQGGVPLPRSPLLTSSYSSTSCSSNSTVNTVINMCSRERDSARDSGVDISEGLLQEPKGDFCNGRIADGRNLLHQRQTQFGYPHVGSRDMVSENFFSDPVVSNTAHEICRKDSEGNASVIAHASIGSDSQESPCATPTGSDFAPFLYSPGSVSGSSMRTYSTICEEESISPEVSSSKCEFFIDRSSPVTPTTNEDPNDNRLFQPDDIEVEEKEDDADDLGLSSSGVDLKNANVNIKGSDVQFGDRISLAMPHSPSKLSPEISVSSINQEKQNESSKTYVPGRQSTPAVHLTINTPPVQGVPMHFPVAKSQSTPVGSPVVTPNDSRNNLQLFQPPPITTNLPQVNPGSFHISGVNQLVIGPQIVVNPNQTTQRENPAPDTSGDADLERILKEAEEKLILNYTHQTKRSLLPWLKGRQIIPMTDFYTESSFVAVDSQGKHTRQTVDLVHTLLQDDGEFRFIVEGEPGMGKTLLACKLALDWAEKQSLHKFKFVFLIFLRDFKDNLEDHVKEELLPIPDEKFRKVWDYCKNNEEKVLFVLDGYDELEKSNEDKIQKLIEARVFQRSKVVVTSRPDALRIVAKRIIVKGFSESQMFEFIGKYFKLVSDDSFGQEMKRIIEKDYKYRKLAKRPLFCVLLCMLYSSDVACKLPERLSDLMFKIMLCLIKWNNKKVGNVGENTEAFPPQHHELFLAFGKLCLHALKTDKTRFSEKEIIEMRGSFDATTLLDLGILSNDSENDILGPKIFWKPVHKIFLEYLAGLYVANHISRDCRDWHCKECREFSSLYRHEHVLQFVVGTLEKKAYLALDGKKYPIFLRLKDCDLLMLLREAGPTRENCRAVAKLLDHDFRTVYTSEVDFEGWSTVIAQRFSNLKSLEIVWRIKSSNPDQESSFSEASPELYNTFFTSLRSNTSINKIKIRATQDGEPFSEQKIALFFSNLEMVLCKENLKELEIKELKMHVSSHLRRAIEGATCQMDKKVLGDLEKLRLDMFMDDEDLYVLCDRLRRCAPNLKELQLTGLVIGSRGFSSMVELLKKSRNLRTLHIAMDKASLQSNRGVFLSEYSKDYTPEVMSKDQMRMNKKAVNESKRAFNTRKCSLETESANREQCQRPRQNSCIPVVSLERIPQQLDKDFYTEEEITNLVEVDNEVNSSREQRSTTSSQQHHLSPREFSDDNGEISCSFGPKFPNSRGSSPSFSGVSPNRTRGISPMAPSNANNERMYFSTVKDPTKELSYLFQDPFHTGSKSTYMVNHYSFIPGDGENQLPLPLCNDGEHKSVFHDLFSALPESTVKNLTLDYPCLYLSTMDLVCLGDAIRKTKHLEMLNLQNLKVAKKYIPVVLGLGQCQSLTTVILESKNVIITDTSFALACMALRNNTTLKSLSLAQWKFSLQDKAMATRCFRDLLSSWKVTDLNLSHCHIDIAVGMTLAPTLFTPPLLLPINGPTRNWSSIKSLKLPNVKLKESLGWERRGHLLLTVLRNCPNLTILDLSVAPNTSTSLDDNATRKFFELLGTNFKKLKELTLRNWEFKFQNYEETCIEIGHLVRSCTDLKVLGLDSVSEVRSGLSIRTPCRTTFLHQLVNNLPRLSELSLCLYHIDNSELDKDSASHLGTCFHDHWNSGNKFKVKFFRLPPTVETALCDALKKDNYNVTTSQGIPLEITVKRRYIFAA